MVVTPEIKETIDTLIERWVPSGQDKFLHIEPRLYMKEIIIRLLETNTIPPTLNYVTAIVKNWRSFLYKRFGTLN